MGEKETKSIELKYNGERYENIAKAVGVALPTIKDWFSTGGKLRRYYLGYEAEQSELSKKKAQRVVTRNVHNAAKTLVNLLGSENENIKFRAAEAILERELDKPMKASDTYQEVKNTQKNVFDLTEPERLEVKDGLRELIDRIERFKKSGKSEIKQSVT